MNPSLHSLEVIAKDEKDIPSHLSQKQLNLLKLDESGARADPDQAHPRRG